MNFSSGHFFRYFATRFSLIFFATAALSSPLFAGAPVKFDSPKGLYHVQVSAGDAGGSDLLPLVAFLTPADGGNTIQINFQIAGYVAPDDTRAPKLFHFSPDETTVVIDNPSSDAIFGYRLIPLVPRPWTPGDIDADSVEWADENRLVFRGQDSAGFYLGVFDARTGRQLKADPALSMFTSFEMIHVTPTTIAFREEDTESHGERCMVFDTVKGKRKIIDCPGL